MQLSIGGSCETEKWVLRYVGGHKASLVHIRGRPSEFQAPPGGIMCALSPATCTDHFVPSA